MAERELTEANLRRFIRRRNTSEFQTNLQFQIDADGCGIDIESLGKAQWEGNNYVWQTPFGKLIEERGKMRLEQHGKTIAGIEFIRGL